MKKLIITYNCKITSYDYRIKSYNYVIKTYDYLSIQVFNKIPSI